MERQGSSRRLRRRHKLRRSADYLRCYRRGGKRHGFLATLHFHPNEERTARLGITASRKVGRAVARHRAKRRVREVFRRWEGRGTLPDLDIVIHLKPAAGQAAYEVLKEELEGLLEELPRGGSSGRAKKGGGE